MLQPVLDTVCVPAYSHSSQNNERDSFHAIWQGFETQQGICLQSQRKSMVELGFGLRFGFKTQILGLPCLSSGWESACQWSGHGFHPLSQRIPHASGQLSPCATTTEPASPGTHALQQEKPLQWEAHAQQLQMSPHSLQVEKAGAEQRRPSMTKNK